MGHPNSGSVCETRRSLLFFAFHLAGCSRSGAHHEQMILSPYLDLFALGTTAVLSFRMEYWEHFSIMRF